MKRITLLFIALAIGLLSTFAQEGTHPRREEILKHKRAFLIKALELTDQEANSLMPILDELDQERFKLWKQSHASGLYRHGHGTKGKAQDSKLSPQELEKAFSAELDRRVKDAELERTYYKKCQSVLPIDKAVRLLQENRRFVREYTRSAAKQRGEIARQKREEVRKKREEIRKVARERRRARD